LADRTSEDIDPVGHRARVVEWCSVGQGNALVSAEQRAPHPAQLILRGPVLDQDDDVVHHPPERQRDPVEGVGDEILELASGRLHPPILACRPTKTPLAFEHKTSYNLCNRVSEAEEEL